MTSGVVNSTKGRRTVYTFRVSNFTLYLDEVYFEDSRARAGALVVLIAKPYNYRIECEPWSTGKGQLDHVWADRERAFALIRLMGRLADEGLLTQEDAEAVVRELDWGWNCPAHPLIPLSGPYDVCMACVAEDEEGVVA
jgi:hypothetical protein